MTTVSQKSQRIIRWRWIIYLALLVGWMTPLAGNAQAPYLLNEPIDISPDFRNFANTYYL